MQSGISASSSLHDAFNTFVSAPDSFALLISITGETLTPLLPAPSSVRFSSDSTLPDSLAQLSAHLTDKEPCYIALRRSPSASTFVIVTYIPSTAPVRAKTLFASTRATVLRELGREKFDENLFCTEKAEVLGLDRELDSTELGKNTAALTLEEKELETIRRAEEEERAGKGMKSQQLMGLGAAGAGNQGKKKSEMMRVGDGVREALKQAAQEDGRMVQLSIDMKTETFILQASTPQTSVSSLSSKIPITAPSYTFYHPPSSPALFFIYSCPSASKIRERMMYASSRLGVTHLGADEGFTATKRFEISEPDELSEETLQAEITATGKSIELGKEDEASSLAASTETAARPTGFARPKRPGR